MSKELVIGSNRHETKVAVLEEDQLVEVYFQRANEYSLAGSIHKGRVTRVLPGMQSAFVDLGLERDTFLYVSDFFEENEDIDPLVDDRPPGQENRQDNRNDRRDRGPVREIARPAIANIEIVEVSSSGAEPPAEAVVAEGATSSAERAPLPDARANRPSGELRGEQRGQPRMEERGDGRSEPRGEPRGDLGPGGDRDRRGRRSRRRTRGRGFPDTKYAQPSSGQQSPVLQRPEEEEEIGEPARDVIILPGESLAKYRNAPPIMSAASPKDAERESEPESESASIEAEEDLESQMEEIELSDAVFVHHPDPELTPEPAIEEALEDALGIKPDVPELPTSDVERPVEDLNVPSTGPEIDDPELPASVQHSMPPALFLVRDEPERLLIETAGSELEPIAEPLTHDLPPVMTPVDFEAEELLEIREELEHPEPEEFEEVETEQPLAAGEASPESPEGGLAGPQIATVRDDGRFMHRSSRRMRRRRGGNRPQNGPIDAVAPSISGAAPALAKPELRIDPSGETRAAPREERSSNQPDRVLPSITDLLKPGQEIIVQIAKEPLGQKGARITSHLALPGAMWCLCRA